MIARQKSKSKEILNHLLTLLRRVASVASSRIPDGGEAGSSEGA
jgi:hypothetical protein